MTTIPPEQIREFVKNNSLGIASAGKLSTMQEVFAALLAGNAVFFLDGFDQAMKISSSGYPGMGVSETETEKVLRGSKDGFSDSVKINSALVRKRLRDTRMKVEEHYMGVRSNTLIHMLFMEDLVREELLDEIRERMEAFQVDGILESGMLEQLTEDSWISPFPQYQTTERPDRAASFLEEGQIVVLMENAPAVIALPMGLMHLYHAPDDTAMRWQYGTFLRLLRITGMLLSLLLPAIYVALTVFHPEGMALSLLTSVIESQSRVPLSLFTSMLLMLLVFSLINEAGARIPGVMGGSLSIVSGLILGQAAVEADMFSPLLIIVVAISGLGSYAVPSFPLTLSLRIAQFFLVVAAGIAGYLGVVLGCFYLLIRMAGITSLGCPYFAPIAPKRPSNPDAVLRMPIWRQRLRGFMANPFQLRRTDGRMRAWDREDK